VFSSTPWPHFTPGKDPMCGEYFMKIFKYFRHIRLSDMRIAFFFICLAVLQLCCVSVSKILQYSSVQSSVYSEIFSLIHLPHVCLFSNTFFIFCTHIIVSNRIAWGQRKQVFLKRNFLPQQVSLCY